MSMRAAVFAGPQRIEIVEAPRPIPGPGQVRVRLEGCGVCGSNVPVWTGRPWFSYPLEPGQPGHEGWGTIDAVGLGVSEARLGQRVAALSYAAYAEYDVVTADAAVRLPEQLAGVPFPAEPLGCALNVLRRSDVAAGQTVVIVGIGFLGALLTSLAARTGARVLAISRRPFALEIARQCGAERAIRLGPPDQVIAEVQELTGGQGCARVVEAVGEQPALDLATELTAVRGRLVIAGYHQDGLRQVDMQKWNWRGLDVINAHERDEREYVAGMRAAVDAAADGRIEPRRLLTHCVPLERLADAFGLMTQRPEGFLKAWVAM